MKYKNMPIEKSSGAIIFRKDKGERLYLLLHYEWGHWDFPKGHIEKGESLEETARREVKEETGIEDVEFVKGFKETIKYFYKIPRTRISSVRGKQGENIMKFVTFFLAKSKTKKIKLTEHIGYEWLPYEKALEKLTFKTAKQILQKSEEFLV
ncbi:MAG: hypothetical protein UU96_C0001G0042 [Parcubacteria group bacterium GW2011_GWC2_42_13]|nr:MAG: hypothetical protein UU96_C0001G0042 [Parcubacteria group bacterium GW2011_GWC2_42_13]